MKKYRMYISVMAALAIIVLGACQKETMNSDLSASTPSGSVPGLKAGSAAPVASASGQGTLTLNDRFQHFAFHASKDVNGDVSGSAELHSPGQGVTLRAKVLCLTVIDNAATVSIEVTSVTDGNLWNLTVGSYLAFKVVDNGEGANSASDQFSDVYGPYPAPRDCDRPFNAPLLDIEGGNIQVKN
jgi:hypothetical protein